MAKHKKLSAKQMKIAKMSPHYNKITVSSFKALKKKKKY